MKSLLTWLRVLVAVVGLACVAAPVTTLAADDDDDKEHHEQLQKRMPTGGCCSTEMQCGHDQRYGQRHGHGCCFLKCLLIWVAIVHVLLASWVFTDIRKRGEGHGIFVVLALLAGLPAAIVYALVRIGDVKKT